MHAAFHSGGLGYSCARILSLLAGARHSVSVAVFDAGTQQRGEPPPSPIEIEQDSVRLHYFPPFDTVTGARSDAPMLPPIDLHNVSVRLGVLIGKNRPDVIVAFYPVPLALPIMVVAQQHSIPAVLAFRGSDVARSIYDPGALAILQMALRAAAACTFAAADLRSLAATIALPLPSWRVIYNGIEPGVLDRTWTSREPTTPAVFGAIGVFKPVKAIEGFLRVVEELGMESRALIVGDFAKSTSERRHFRTRFTGVVPREISLDLLDSLDVFVAPSLSEGCPNAVLEAMAAGKAILCSRVGAMADLLEHRRSAYFVDDWSDASMRDALLELDGDANLRLALGRRAQDVASTLTVARELAEWDRLLREVTG